MKNKVLNLILALIVLSCNTKDETVESHSFELENHSFHSVVKGIEIPEIIDFVKRKSPSGDLIFNLNSENSTRGADLSILELDTTSITVSTNTYNLSNYSFGLKKVNPTEEISILNLVVKETSKGNYGYIVEYKPEVNWWNMQDWEYFDGNILFYRIDGTFVADYTYQGGANVNREVVDPCCEGNCDSSGGDTGNNGGSSDGGVGGDSGSTGGNDGNTGTQGCTIVLTLFVCCNNNYDLHPPSECGCADPTGTYLEVELDCPNARGNLDDILRSPDDCPDCNRTNGDSCPCAVDGETCSDNSDPSNENSDVTINDVTIAYNLPLILGLNQYLDPNLSQAEIDWIHDPNHPENFEFAELALLALQNGGQASFDDIIIIDESFLSDNRMMSIYNYFYQGSNLISNYLQNFYPEFSVAHLRLSTDENFSTNYPEHSNATGITLPPEQYVIDVIFNSDSTSPGNQHDLPKIIMVQSFIHELIHAEIFRKLMSLSNNPNVNFHNWPEADWRNFIRSIVNEFPGLWDYFERYTLDTSTPSNAQHQQMASHYRDFMVQILEDYDNGAHSQPFYEALSWIGLKGTVAWDNLTQSERDSINSIIDEAIETEPYD